VGGFHRQPAKRKGHQEKHGGKDECWRVSLHLALCYHNTLISARA
jgi:hypothetical protein